MVKYGLPDLELLKDWKGGLFIPSLIHKPLINAGGCFLNSFKAQTGPWALIFD